MSEQPQSYSAWILQIKHFGGGKLGGLVITLTVFLTPVLAYYGMDSFPPGKYPQIMLAIPGLLMAGMVFFILSAALWPLKKARKSS